MDIASIAMPIFKGAISFFMIGAVFISLFVTKEFRPTRKPFLISLLFSLASFIGAAYIWLLPFNTLLSVLISAALVVIAVQIIRSSVIREGASVTGYLASASLAIATVAIWYADIPIPMIVYIFLTTVGMILLLMSLATRYEFSDEPGGDNDEYKSSLLLYRVVSGLLIATSICIIISTI